MAGGLFNSERRWRGFAVAVLLGTAGLLASYLALAVIVDPYETGRVRLLSRGAIRPQGPRTAIAWRGRDPAFEGALIGNSHLQLIEPSVLTERTGIPFVQLTIPATGAAEHLAVLRWFLRNHLKPAAIVLGADAFWCADDPSFPNPNPFPFWLIGDWPGYLAGLLRLPAAEEVASRIGWLVLKKRPKAPADGWWNYEPDYLALGFGRDPVLIARLDKPVGAEPEPHRGGPFPIAEAFRVALAAIPQETPVVLVMPPVYAAGEPPAGSPRAKAEAACRATIRAELARHRLSAVVDWRDGRPPLTDPSLFFDQTHYRLPVAREIGAEIANAIIHLRANDAD